MNQRANQMRREAARIISQIAMKRYGVVSSYDQSAYSAKVFIQPENTESGWLPISTPWAGNGWGFYAPPTPGDIVEIEFQEGGKEAGIVGGRHYGNVFQPLSVPAGEFWIVDKVGNSFKFSGGKVLVNGNTEIDVTTPTLNITTTTVNITASSVVNVTAPNVNVDGNLNVTGTITADGDIYDLANGSGSMDHIRTVYDSHTHGGIQPGGSNTAVPNQTL